MPQFRYFLQPRSFIADSDRNLKFLYIIRILRDVINHIGLFFLPIFLFTVGKDIPWLAQFELSDFQKGMLTIALYFASERLVIFVSAILAGKIIHFQGFSKSLFYSHLLRVAAFVALCFVPYFPEALFVAAVLEGLQSNLFWPSYFTLFSKHAHMQHMGKDLGLMQFFIQLAGVFIPALSGFIAFYFGFTALFFMAIAVTFFSMILILFMDMEFTTDNVSWQEFKSWLKEPTFARLTTSFVGRYVHDAVLFLWPLYIFIILGAIDRVGYLYTFSLFLALIFIYFTGIYIDHTKSKKSFFFSGGFLSVMWMLRTQVWNIWSIAAVNAVEKLLASTYWLFYDTITLRRSKGSQALSYFIYREIIMSAAAIIFWCLFALFFWYNQSWNGLFVLAGIGVLFSLLLQEHHHERS